ncbi:MAG TPA: amino acid ABC transporter permease [Actinomycetota bacterium]|nr:amino acid ABC transporter permease [Actinomycetota bacterium]
MRAEAQGAGQYRPPAPRGIRERLELAGARVPWRVKLIVVYALIGIVFVVAFNFVQFDVAWMREHAWNIIRAGIPLTLLICVGAIALATILALLGALARLSRNPLAFGVAGFYTSFFRGTPLLVQIFLIYFGLAEVGIRLQQAGYGGISNLFILEPVPAGILALGLNYGAYMTEIFRAGIQSVGHGQAEAAEALGMTYRQKMRRVVLPQAVRMIIPPTGNEFIAMLKDSALVYTIGALELFRQADLAGRADFRSLEAYLLAAGVYWVLTGIFSLFQGRLERRMSRGYVRAVQRGGGPKRVRPTAQPGIVAPEPAVGAQRE